MANCPDCGVKPGKNHKPSCDVERCACCGYQALSCGCTPKQIAKYAPLPWTGKWPDQEVCAKLGWYARIVPGQIGWQPCNRNDNGAAPDLNRLYVETVWDPKTRTRVIRNRSKHD